MLQKNLKIEKKEKQEFNPIPPDVYPVELFDINAKEVPQYTDKSKMETVLDFQFTILDGIDTDFTKLRGRNLWRNYVPTYIYEGKNGKNALWQICEAMLKRSLTLEEEASIDGEWLNKLIGKQCRVVVENSTSGDKIYSNIKSFLPAKEELEPLNAEEKEKAAVKKKEPTEKELNKVNPAVITDIDEVNSII